MDLGPQVYSVRFEIDAEKAAHAPLKFGTLDKPGEIRVTQETEMYVR